MKNLTLIFLGGGLGSTLRYLAGFLGNRAGEPLPWGTLAANILGSLFIGILIGIINRSQGWTTAYTALLVTGFCGGFTTFSTFALENTEYLKNDQFLSALTYTLISVILGVSAVFFGLWISKKLPLI